MFGLLVKVEGQQTLSFSRVTSAVLSHISLAWVGFVPTSSLDVGVGHNSSGRIPPSKAQRSRSVPGLWFAWKFGWSVQVFPLPELVALFLSHSATVSELFGRATPVPGCLSGGMGELHRRVPAARFALLFRAGLVRVPRVLLPPSGGFSGT